MEMGPVLKEHYFGCKKQDDEISDLIEEGRDKGGVLIHCFTGISRSPTFIIAYIMRKKVIYYDVVLAYLKKQRSVIHPSDHFKK